MSANQKSLVAIEQVKSALAKGKKLSPSCRKAGISTTTFYRHVPEYKTKGAEGFIVDRASDDLPAKPAGKKRGRKPNSEKLVSTATDTDYVRKLEHFIASKLVETMQ